MNYDHFKNIWTFQLSMSLLIKCGQKHDELRLRHKEFQYCPLVFTTEHKMLCALVAQLLCTTILTGDDWNDGFAEFRFL